MKKQYVIESKGFTQGLGSTVYRNKRKQQLQEIKRQLAEIEDIEKTKSKQQKI